MKVRGFVDCQVPDGAGPEFHFWEIDGPNIVVCECGAEGRIVVVDDE